jgi:hypothetical protein
MLGIDAKNLHDHLVMVQQTLSRSIVICQLLRKVRQARSKDMYEFLPGSVLRAPNWRSIVAQGYPGENHVHAR